MLQAIVGPSKRVKTFVRTMHHMGLLPLKQKSAPAAEGQLSLQLAGLLANQGGNFEQPQDRSIGGAMPANARLTLSAALDHGASASRFSSLAGAAGSGMQYTDQVMYIPIPAASISYALQLLVEYAS